MPCRQMKWILNVVFAFLLLSGIAFAEAGSTIDLKDKRWFHLGPGIAFWPGGNGVMATFGGNMPVDPGTALQGDLDVGFGSSVSFGVLATGSYSLRSMFKEPGEFNPYVRGGVQLWQNGVTGFHLVAAIGSEIPIGPTIMVDPFVMAFLGGGSYTILGVDGTMWMSSTFFGGLGLIWGLGQSFTLKGTLGLRF